MTLKEYFNTTRGIGVLSTADAEGRVDAAIYSAPYFLDDGTLAFIMSERLTYRNTKANPYAAYLFIESGGNYNGIRLFLKKVKEDDDPGLVSFMSTRHLMLEEGVSRGPKHIVYYTVLRILPLLGTRDVDVTTEQ
ncbi:MAG: pyridoxamine 5'-phosphate oxidase family protein [Dissulfurispiraceae bacterium]|nr:pyridoxamine 5'-phosphate oxidase family protein [Dissulfurispiraceae bacterium]